MSRKMRMIDEGDIAQYIGKSLWANSDGGGRSFLVSEVVYFPNDDDESCGSFGGYWSGSSEYVEIDAVLLYYAQDDWHELSERLEYL